MGGLQVRTDGRPGDPRPGPASQGSAGHQILLRAREEATIGGVLHVQSFDDHEIILDTDLGTLTLTGHDLRIKQLDLAQGTFWVQGLVDAISYAATTGSKRRGTRPAGRGGMLGRLFR